MFERGDLPALTDPVPRVLAPSLNVTLPVGVPAPGKSALTPKLNFIVCPVPVGFMAGIISVLVAALFTCCEMPGEVLGALLPSPT